MTATNVKRAFSTPESQFRHPQHVLRDSDLSYDDKIAVLRKWKLGLVQRQMDGEDPDETGSVEVASQLAEVTQAIKDLRQTQ